MFKKGKEAVRQYAIWRAFTLIPGFQMDGKANRRARRAQR